MITRTQLKAHFQAQGIVISNTQLRYWQKQGILEKPIEDPGKDALYSDAAIPRVEKIWDLLQRNFSVEEIKLELWKNEEKMNIRPLFKKALKEYRKSVNKPKEEMVYDSTDKRFSEKLLRQARKRVGTQNMPTFMHLMLSFVNPQDAYPPTNKSDRNLDQEIFEKGIDMDFLKRKAEVEIPDVYTLIEEYRPILDPGNLERLLHDTSDDDLRAAYTEWQELLEHLSASDRIMEEAHAGLDKKPPKRRAKLSEAIQNASSVLQCVDVLVWLAIRQKQELYAGILQNMEVAKSLGNSETKPPA